MVSILEAVLTATSGEAMIFLGIAKEVDYEYVTDNSKQGESKIEN